MSSNVTVIKSGRQGAQILVDGYRLRHNKTCHKTSISYFDCVFKARGCHGTAATVGDLQDDMVTLKYHNRPSHKHDHPPDAMEVLVQKQLHDFRQRARENPDQAAKPIYDNLTAKNLETLTSPEKEDFLERLPPFAQRKDQYYRIRSNLRPTNPKSVDEVNVPAYGNLGKTESGKNNFEDFLFIYIYSYHCLKNGDCSLV